MFPLPWNKAYRKQDGSLTTLSQAIASGGSSYELPTASSETKGGVKIGSGLLMTGEVLSAVAELPVYSISEAGKVLGITNEGTLAWIEVSVSGATSYKAPTNILPENIITTAEEVTT